MPGKEAGGGRGRGVSEERRERAGETVPDVGSVETASGAALVFFSGVHWSKHAWQEKKGGLGVTHSKHA